jgi:SGNH domain (fused to AT3 domains)
LVAIGAVSYVASEWGSRNHPSATFYLAHSRAWERLTGSVAAFVLTRKDTAATKALLFGDSFAGQWEPFWNKVGAKTGLNIHAVSTNWCFPALSDDFTGPKTIRDVDQCKLNCNWVRQNAGFCDVIILGGRWSDINGQGLDQDVLDYVAFRQSSTDARIIIMASPPALNRVTVEEFVATGKGIIDAVDALNAAIQTVQSNFVKLAASRKRVFYFSEDTLFGPDGANQWRFTADGYRYSLDGMHVSIYGAVASADDFLGHGGSDLIAKIVQRPIK